MKTFKVSGHARVPIRVEITVQAMTEETAIFQATRKWHETGYAERRSFIIPHSTDPDAAVSFSATQAIEQPSDPSEESGPSGQS